MFLFLVEMELEFVSVVKLLIRVQGQEAATAVGELPAHWLVGWLAVVATTEGLVGRSEVGEAWWVAARLGRPGQPRYRRDGGRP